MLISKKNLTLYFYEKKIIDVKEYLLKEYNIDCPILTRNYGIIYNKRLFLKQLRFNDIKNKEIFTYEAKFYNFVNIDENFQTLLPHLPKFYLFDSSYYIIITEWIANAKNISDTSKKRLPKSILYQIGGTIAKLHHVVLLPIHHFQYFKPWILSDNNIMKNVFLSRASSKHEFIQELRDNTIIEAIENCKKLWQNNCLIHGDLKFDNILYQRTTKKIFLIDWELVGIGDGLWDLGVLLSEVIRQHVFARKYILISQFVPLDPILDDNEILAKIKALLKGYTTKEKEINLQKVFMFAGLGLISKTFEIADKNELGLRGVELVQIGKKLLLSPQKFQEVI